MQGAYCSPVFCKCLAHVAGGKEEGLPLTVETGQHYLYFNAEDIGEGQTQFKCAPPIREKENNHKLWEALASGLIDFVATDHSPCTPDLKETGSGNFMKAWGGISSIQFAYPALWTAAKNRGFGMADVSRWLSAHPAKLAGQGLARGGMEKGMYADLALLDDGARFLLQENMILHKHKLSPYLGETLSGVVEQTYLGGKLVFDRGSIVNLNQGNAILRL